MREILFRGKQVFFNDWIEGTGIFNDGINTWLSFNEPEKAIAYGLNHKRVHPETIGQFTGLTDKNGKKIFEGDRCRVSRPCVLAYGKITFQNGCFWFVDDGPGGMLRLCDVKMNGFEIEVIGNIHDNPELLENP